MPGSATESQVRAVTTISAIRRGIEKTRRRSQPGEDRPRASARPSLALDRWSRLDARPSPSEASVPRHQARITDYSRRGPAVSRSDAQTDPINKPPRRETSKSLAVPYATPASEFLFGRSVVESALKAQQRELYRLYHVKSAHRAGPKDAESERLIGLARSLGVKICPLDSVRLLDVMSRGRPHNGLVLDASPLTKVPITALLSPDASTGVYRVELGAQSQEESVSNGASSMIDYSSGGSRHPFLLFLDGIIDPGNLGAVLRSAFFLGADGVVLSSHSAPLSPVVLKASAGAAEVLPLLAVHKTGPFIQASRQQGWKFFAAVPAQMQRKFKEKPHRNLATMGFPLTEHPCVLMLGGEGPGLWQDLIRKADYLLTIDGRRAGEAGVDSLNVSVAAALACDAFMKGAPTGTNDLWS